MTPPHNQVPTSSSGRAQSNPSYDKGVLVPNLGLDTPEAIEDFALKDDYALNPQYIALVIDAADRGDGLRLRELLDALHPADVADLLGFLSEDYRAEIIPWIPADSLGEILPELDEDIREEVIETLGISDLAEVLQELDSDDATAVFEDLEADQQRAVLAAMPESEREAMVTSLSFEEETAGRLMQREVMAAPLFWTVGQAIDHMRDNADDLPELFFDIYVVDPSYRPVGALSVSTLLRARRETNLSALMESTNEIPVDMDQEEVAYIFEKYRLISAPIVDHSGRLIGQITVDDIVHIIQAENREDLLALAGMSDVEGRDTDIFGMVKSRLPWLLVNLLTAFASSSVISLFQDSIHKLVALAILMPIVASMGGNFGTQTLTMAVRALSARELTQANATRRLWREIATGLIVGACIALGLSSVTYVVFHDAKLSLVIALAAMINFVMAALAGTLVPMTASHLGIDPAGASPIFVTLVTDFCGFFSFLGLASLILLR